MTICTPSPITLGWAGGSHHQPLGGKVMRTITIEATNCTQPPIPNGSPGPGAQSPGPGARGPGPGARGPELKWHMVGCQTLACIVQLIVVAWMSKSLNVQSRTYIACFCYFFLIMCSDCALPMAPKADKQLAQLKQINWGTP